MHIKYIIRVTYLIIIPGLLIVLTNWFVNPYDVFDSFTLEGVNALKPESSRRQRLSKAYKQLRMKPSSIVLGTSRSLIMVPDNTQKIPQPFFNLGLASSSLYEQYRYLQHSQSIQPLKLVIIGLDYFAFNDHVEAQFEEARLNVDRDMQTHSVLATRLYDQTSALLSLSALKSSVYTIRHNRTAQRKSSGANENGLQISSRVAAKGGHRQLFNEYESRFFLENEPKLNTDIQCPSAENPNTDDTKYTYFVKLLHFAHQHDIQLLMFISPSHARHMELWRMTGNWQSFENWKRTLVKINKDIAKHYAKHTHTLWDFSGYNEVTQEVVPALNDRVTPMKWYSEDSHYTAVVADLILNSMLKNNASDSLNFGVKLTPQYIEPHLLNTCMSGQEYRSRFKEDIDELQKIAKKALLRFQ